MESLARTLVVVGVVLVALGVLLYWRPSLPIGRLPGDVRIERPGFTLYLPVMSCLLASVLLSTVLWLASRFR